MLRNSSFTLLLMMLILVLSCKKIDNKDTEINNEDAETFVHDDITREYILYIPDSYDGNSAVPLMFNFHGFGGTAAGHMNSADMRSLADEENFILVYPQGTLLDGSPHWNAGLDTDENKSDADDFGFIGALIDHLASELTIDEKRVYACGYSNGAFFTYAMACFHSDKIAAIGSVSGTMLEETLTNCNPLHPTAVIHLHGTSDNVVPYAGGSQGLSSIDAVTNYWVDFNNTNTAPMSNSVNDSGLLIEQFVYTNGDNEVSLEHYKVNNGDHVWFDLNYEEKNTNQLIWDFVSRYDMDGLR